MAAQRPNGQAVKWKPGALCDLFDREQRKWKEGEVISSFSDENGEWVKVRCGPEIRDVLGIDPDLRARTLITSDQMKELQNAAVQIPNIAPILERAFPSSSGRGLYGHSDSLVVNVAVSVFWSLSQ